MGPNAIPGPPRNSHALWYEDPWVSSDLLGLMLLNADPQRRGLAPQDAPKGVLCWTFRPDSNGPIRRLFVPAATGPPPASAPASR